MVKASTVAIAAGAVGFYLYVYKPAKAIGDTIMAPVNAVGEALGAAGNAIGEAANAVGSAAQSAGEQLYNESASKQLADTLMSKVTEVTTARHDPLPPEVIAQAQASADLLAKVGAAAEIPGPVAPVAKTAISVVNTLISTPPNTPVPIPNVTNVDVQAGYAAKAGIVTAMTGYKVPTAPTPPPPIVVTPPLTSTQVAQVNSIVQPIIGRPLSAAQAAMW